jgi:uncharacterized membrane protein
MDIFNINTYHAKYVLIILVIFLALDLPMILSFNNKMYDEQFKKINKGEMNVGIHTMFGTLLAYLSLAFGLYYFVISPGLVASSTPSYFDIMIRGMVFGLVLYGMYNGTNMAIINEYMLKVFFVDTIWGTVLCGLIAVIFLFIHNNILTNTPKVNTS